MQQEEGGDGRLIDEIFKKSMDHMQKQKFKCNMTHSHMRHNTSRYGTRTQVPTADVSLTLPSSGSNQKGKTRIKQQNCHSCAPNEHIVAIQTIRNVQTIAFQMMPNVI